MSKRKLAKKRKLSKKKYVSYYWRKMDREIISRNTLFDCELNSVFIEAINLYKSLPFSTHDLWVEIINADRSQLIIKWSKNPLMIKDLSIFWMIYHSVENQRRGINIRNNFSNSSEAIDHILKHETDYHIPKTYKEYRYEKQKRYKE